VQALLDEQPTPARLEPIVPAGGVAAVCWDQLVPFQRSISAAPSELPTASQLVDDVHATPPSWLLSAPDGSIGASLDQVADAADGSASSAVASATTQTIVRLISSPFVQFPAAIERRALPEIRGSIADLNEGVQMSRVQELRRRANRRSGRLARDDDANDVSRRG